MSSRTPALRFIFVTLLLDVLGFGLLIPVAPRLLARIQGIPMDEAGPTVGALLATYSAMQFVFAPFLGALSDRFGRRPVLLVSLFGSGLDYFALALSPTLWFLFLTRALNGISGASMAVASAYVADVTRPEERAGAFGMIGAAFGIGFVLGPALGGALGKLDVHYPFYAAGLLTLANWLYGYFVLPESLPRERRAKLSFANANPLGVFFGLGRYPFVLWMAVALFALNLAQFMLHTTWVLYTAHRYGWDELDVGLSLMLVGIGSAIVQGGLARRIIPALGERRSLVFGIAIGALAYVAYGSATAGWMVYVTIALASFGGIAMPAGQAMITKTVSFHEQGRVQGALAGLQSVANVIGPLVGASVFTWSIAKGSAIYLPGATFYGSATLALLGLAVAAFAVRRHAPRA